MVIVYYIFVLIPTTFILIFALNYTNFLIKLSKYNIKGKINTCTEFYKKYCCMHVIGLQYKYIHRPKGKEI